MNKKGNVFSIIIIILVIICIIGILALGYIKKQANEKDNTTTKLNTSTTLTASTEITKEQLNIVGNWSPYKIEKENQEVELKEYYGTGIKYGGYLTFNNDLTYSELIGVYSDEVVNSLTGTYTLQDKIITLTSKDNKQSTYEIIEENNTNVIKEVTEENYIIYFKQVIE